jgi:hypothetical protein
VEIQVKDIQEACRSVRRQIHILRAATDREIDAAFMILSQQLLSCG